MTFPTAGSQVYYNEDGEPLGWDAAPSEADYYSVYEDELEEVEPEDEDPATCKHGDLDVESNNGIVCIKCDSVVGYLITCRSCLGNGGRSVFAKNTLEDRIADRKPGQPYTKACFGCNGTGHQFLVWK